VHEPLVGNHSVGEEHEEEGVGGAEHRLAPRNRSADRTTLAVDEHEAGEHESDREGEQERLVHPRPFQNVDCQHAAGDPFRALRERFLKW